jgi:hypothetical protein
MPTTTTTPPHLFDTELEAPGSRATFAPRTAGKFDLRIVAFILLVAAVQLCTGKRPFGQP